MNNRYHITPHLQTLAEEARVERKEKQNFEFSDIPDDCLRLLHK